MKCLFLIDIRVNVSKNDGLIKFCDIFDADDMYAGYVVCATWCTCGQYVATSSHPLKSNFIAHKLAWNCHLSIRISERMLNCRGKQKLYWFGKSASAKKKGSFWIALFCHPDEGKIYFPFNHKHTNLIRLANGDGNSFLLYPFNVVTLCTNFPLCL